MNKQMNETAALLIVDVQNGFINEATRHIPQLVAKLQRNYRLRVATRFINQEHSPFREIMGWHRFSPGSSDVELAFELVEGTAVLDKAIYTCVDEKFLHMLRERNIEEVHLCGIDTDICVTKCAVDLFERNVRPVVLTGCCASHGGPDMHEAAVKILRRYIGAANVNEASIDIDHSA